MGTVFSFLKKKDSKISDDKNSNIRSINSSSSSIDRRRAAEISDFYGGGLDRRRAAEISDFYGGGVDRRRAAEISDFYVRGVDRRRAATDKSAFYGGGVDRRRPATEKSAFYERGVTSMANEQSAKEKSAFYVGEGVTSMSNQQSVTTKPDYSAEKKLSTSHHKQGKYGFIPDNFKTLEEVTSALRKEGLESSNLIVGIDFTKSNEWTGKNSFNNRSLHAIGDTPNPYEKAISIIGKTLAPFDDDNLIPCFGFGDATTHDREVFSFHNDQSSCHGFEEVLACYKRIVPNLRLAGPTSFAPAVEAAMDIVEKTGGQYHVLVIIADGQVTRSVNTDDGELSPQEKKTIESIVNASSYPLSIILIGVGDGPWDDMRKFDDKIPAREFDNFQFVNFTEIMNKNMTSSEKEASFALAALMEIPFQYKAAVELGILGRVTGRAKKIVPRPPPIAYTNRAPIREASNLSTTMVDERREMVCPICLTNGKDLAFGCGHMTCRDCGSRISLCPICRVPINNRLRIFTG